MNRGGGTRNKERGQRKEGKKQKGGQMLPHIRECYGIGYWQEMHIMIKYVIQADKGLWPEKKTNIVVSGVNGHRHYSERDKERRENLLF